MPAGLVRIEGLDLQILSRTDAQKSSQQEFYNMSKKEALQIFDKIDRRRFIIFKYIISKIIERTCSDV